jgi:glycosyltransferase involved in cell wall biosynthesis
MASTPYEGFGTMSLEPMACGTAVVTPDRLGTEQFPDGTVLYARVDPDDIADKVIHLLTNGDERKERERKGLEFAGSVTWKKMVDDVESFLQEQLL